MFDLWYSIGAGIMFPAIFDEVAAKGDAAGVLAGRPAGAALFYPIPAIQFCNAKDPNAPVLNPNIDDHIAAAAPVIKDSGYIVAPIIDDIRLAVREAVKTRFPQAPPISLYTAGKFCQMMTVPAFDLKKNIALANKGYQAAVADLPAARSVNFAAFLGLFLIDPALTNSLSGAVGTPATAKQAMDEFQITDPGEAAAFAKLATPGDFMTAQSNLLGSADDTDTWTTCREQFVGWSDRTDGMVI